jgi:hypothetical protein
MTKADDGSLLPLVLLLLVVFALAKAACVFDRSGLAVSPPGPSAEEYRKCEAKIRRCAKGEQQVAPTLDGPAQYNIAGTYLLDDDFGVNDSLYIDLNDSWVVQAIEHPPLIGGILVRTDWQHREVNEGEFLSVDFPSFDHIEDLYVAYDGRVNPTPEWLADTQRYQRVTDATGTPLSIVTSTPDESGASPTVRLALYRVVDKTTGHPVGQPMWTFPGNNCGAPALPGPGTCAAKASWPGKVSGKNKAMYVVVLVRKPVPDCSKTTDDERRGHEGCSADEAQAKADATKKCEEARLESAKTGQNPAYFECSPPVCTDVTACPRESTLVQTRDFKVSSVVEFEPSKFKSAATILVQGQQKVTKDVTGRIYFEYSLDELGGMKRIRIDGMDLRIDPVDTDAGRFTDVAITLREASRAGCQDTPPPWAGDRPCTRYTVPAGKLKALLGGKLDGKVLLFDPANTGVVDILIDHTSRTFQIQGGPLATTVQVDGDSLPLEIDIDLLGHFLNFAPHAVGGLESTKWVECSGGRDKIRSNRDPILLDSAGSFEVYGDVIPPDGYEWYENYTWASEKLWGKGPKLTIPPHQVSFGVHRMTLLVRDPFGVGDTDDFQVEVRDTTAPEITAPNDALYLVTPPGKPPVKVPLGTAWAYDVCFGDVELRNDAPPDGRFPAGVTTVTWTAEDGAGNTATGTQDVYVFTAPDANDPGALVPAIQKLARHAAKVVEKDRGAAERCDETPLRATDPRAIAEAAGWMAALAERMELTGERAGRRAEATALLRSTSTRLGDAAELAERARSATGDVERRELCGSAVRALDDAAQGIEQAVQMLEGMARPIQP